MGSVRYLGRVLIAGAVLVSNTAGALVGDFSPWIGIDFYYALMRARGYWNTVFPACYPGGSIYVGTKFHEYFGVELGFSTSTWQAKDWTLTQGTTFFNSTVQSTVSGVTKVRRSEGYIDLVVFLPGVDCFEWLGFIGYGWVLPDIRTSLKVPAGTNSTSSALSSLSSKGGGVFRMGIGGQYMVTDMFGIRAKIGWESTSTVRIKGNQNFAANGYEPKAFNDTTALSAGVFMRF